MTSRIAPTLVFRCIKAVQADHKEQSRLMLCTSVQQDEVRLVHGCCVELKLFNLMENYYVRL